MASTKIDSDLVRAEIVTRFARFEPLGEILAWLKDVHEIEVGHTALSYYNLDNDSSRKKAARKWADLFDTVRAQIMADLNAIPTAHLAVRVRERDLMFWGVVLNPETRRRKAKLSSVDREDALTVLREIAEDIGGKFVNPRAGGSGGGAKDGSTNPDPAGDLVQQVKDALFQMDSATAAP